MWNSSHWKLPGNWRKGSCTMKAIGKIHTELGRKGRETIRSGPVPLGGNSEEEGEYILLTTPHWSEGCHDWEKSSAVRYRRDSGLKWLLNRVGTAITDTYTGAASEAPHASDGGQTTTAQAPPHPRAHMGPSCSSTAPPCQCWEREEHTLKENQLCPTLKVFCSSHLIPTSAPNMAVAATKQRGGPASHLALTLHLQPHLLSRW